MAILDWNGDGKNDFIDDMIECSILMDALEDEESVSDYSDSGYYGYADLYDDYDDDF